MKYGIVCGSAWRMSDHWGVWFRIFGYGLAVSTMTPLFSERSGYATGYVRIGKVKIKILKP